MKKFIYLSLLFACHAAFTQAQLVKIVQHYKISKEAPAFYPVFSTDGKELLYTSENYKGLYLFDLESKKTNLVTEVEGAGFNPVFSEDNHKVYYRQTERTDMRQQKTLMYFDRRNDRNVRNRALEVPECGQLRAYTSKLKLIVERNGVQEVLKPLEDTDRYLWGSLSPDHTKILFTAVGKGTFVCDLSGKLLVKIGYLNAPVWYGNDKIVGMVDKDDEDQIISSSIVIVSADGEQRQILVPSVRKAMYPAANKQSRRIAYNDLAGEIYILELEK